MVPFQRLSFTGKVPIYALFPKNSYRIISITLLHVDASRVRRGKITLLRHDAIYSWAMQNYLYDDTLMSRAKIGYLMNT